MTTILGIVGGLVLLNATLAAALLMRRNRPEARAKLAAWVLKGERRPNRMTRQRGTAGERRKFLNAGARAYHAISPQAWPDPHINLQLLEIPPSRHALLRHALLSYAGIRVGT
jgi:hypothetical protein